MYGILTALAVFAAQIQAVAISGPSVSAIPVLSPAPTALPIPIPGANSSPHVSDFDPVNYQAFSGDQCDGDAGVLQPMTIDTYTCMVSDDRHSFQVGVVPQGTTLLVQVYADLECQGDQSLGTQIFNGTLGGPECMNVNTGQVWRSAMVTYCDNC